MDTRRQVLGGSYRLTLATKKRTIKYQPFLLFRVFVQEAEEEGDEEDEDGEGAEEDDDEEDEEAEEEEDD